MPTSNRDPDPAGGAYPAAPPPAVTPAGTGWKLLAATTLLALVLGIIYIVVHRQRAAAENRLALHTAAAASAPPVVDVVPVAYAAPLHVITLPGQTRAWYESTIYARINGYLQKWLVDIGDHVHAGQLLATIETPELEQQLLADRAKVAADQAQVKLARANANFSAATYARYKDAPPGMVSDLERDQKAADYQTGLARVAAAESDLQATQADVDRVRAMLAFTQVTAPFAGVITERRVDIGDLVTAGSTANTTALFALAQSNPMRVFAEVPEGLVREIHDGDPATLTVRAYPERNFAGAVARNAQSITAAAKTLRVEVDVPNPDGILLPGMYGVVHFQIRQPRRALQVPASAMNFRSGGPQVAVVSAQGRVSFKDVTITSDLGTVVEIGAGLAPGERVVLNISNRIADGDLVTPQAAELTPPSVPPTDPKTRLATDGRALH